MAKPANKTVPAAPKAANGTLPASIVNAAPTTAQILKNVTMAAMLVPHLAKDLAKSKKGGAIQMARAYVALHRLKARIDEEFKPLDELYKQYKEVEIPALFEQDGVTNVPLAEGFRVGISSRYLASIKPDQRDAAYDWLRANGLEAIITETVNSQTLSAALKKELEENNKGAPEELFNVALVPNTSVTKT